MSVVTKESIRLRSLDEASTSDIASMALDAGKNARQKALDADLEVTYIDDDGNIAIDKKMPDGTISTRLKEQE
ncbi:hypothetical protein [Marinibactrum halimedae]|uniref:Uncharacterized protein n=1 Tax=Marinibactrum halimedae TaxID=1444977 RepID=A0AA37T2V8_9GAMM|nr:hypothetical protein [Marinibactrum halimedae]MCD9457442.1 hypothetical protein [Marinibactrum halimedae]GLS25508.1 hypothetical protein GCM10007877_12220 [Marinibactrum halimedae]